MGLTPVLGDVYTHFEKAELVFVCRKVYRAPILEKRFVDRSIISVVYPQRDYHDMYIGEIVKVMARDKYL